MKTVGIIGGMGTMASLDFFAKIVKNTDAKCDKDHLHILVENNSEIPDRTSFILGSGEDPTDHLIDTAKKLESIGADFVVMPCNTAHYFYKDIAGEINIPMLNMIEETAKEISKRGLKTVTLLATLGTYKSNIYKSIFKSHKISLIYPSQAEQMAINNLIYKIKSETDIASDDFSNIIKNLETRGTEGIILGCTELPLLLENISTKVDLIDPTLILAKAVILHSGQNLKL